MINDKKVICSMSYTTFLENKKAILNSLKDKTGIGIKIYKKPVRTNCIGWKPRQGISYGMNPTVYIYNKNMIKEILAENRKYILHYYSYLYYNNSSLFNPDSFISFIHRNTIKKKTKFFNIIADLFGDKNNPNRK